MGKVTFVRQGGGYGGNILNERSVRLGKLCISKLVKEQRFSSTCDGGGELEWRAWSEGARMLNCVVRERVRGLHVVKG